MFRIPLARAFLIIAFWYLADHLSKLISSFAVTSDSDSFCQNAGYFVQITALGSLLSMLFLVTQLWLLVARRRTWSFDKVRRLDVLFLALTVVVPLVSAALLALARPWVEADEAPLFGREGMWCWISRKHVTAQLVALYIPMYAIMVVVLAAFYHMGSIVYENATQRRPSQADLEEQKRDPLMHFAVGATVYIGVFILCWIPSSLGRFYTMFTGSSNEVLSGVQAVFTGLRGACMHAILMGVGFFHFWCYYYIAWSQRDRTAKVAARISIQVTDGEAK
jgi:hypothetical protein